MYNNNKQMFHYRRSCNNAPRQNPEMYRQEEMEFPVELRNKINELAEREDTRALTQAAERLSGRYRDESGDGKRSASERRDILAYAAVRMPATFAAVSRALELSLKCFDGEIGSVLDIGAGTGAGAAAAALITGCEDVVCVEREQNMIDMGRELLGCMGMSCEWVRRDISQGIGKKADLVICSYCLNELPAAKRKAAIAELAEAAEKLLLIVEPGTPAAFSGITQLRRELVTRGFGIAAPCPDGAGCPLPDDDWCHFTARAARSRIHKKLKGAEVPYEDEKFCFLAAARTNATPCGGRILRRPFIESGRITLRICSRDGIYERLVTKKDPRFKAARKSDTGDEFRT